MSYLSAPNLLSDESLRWVVAQHPANVRTIYGRELACRTLALIWALGGASRVDIEARAWLAGLAAQR